MDDNFYYTIIVRGQVRLEDMETFGPSGMTLEPAGLNSTRLFVFTDQAGLIGLFRQMHGQGMVLVAFHSDREHGEESLPDPFEALDK